MHLAQAGTERKLMVLKFWYWLSQVVQVKVIVFTGTGCHRWHGSKSKSYALAQVVTVTSKNITTVLYARHRLSQVAQIKSNSLMHLAQVKI